VLRELRRAGFEPDAKRVDTEADYLTSLDRIVFWNSGAERLYGWSASEAIGRPIGELILADPQELESISNLLLSTGENHGQLKEITKDKREVIVEVWSTLIRNEDGTPRSILSINNDITERKRLESQLLRAQRLESIGTLASGVAHDLNNILTPILICTEVLRERVTDEESEKTLSSGSTRNFRATDALHWRRTY
jgi:two-component system cell cycle sensor histidine kinase/response regulator CckA